LAERQITNYLTELADFHCRETVTQDKLSTSGHVEATARAEYDYLIMMSGTGEDFQLNESRLESTKVNKKQPQPPMLVTNGIATVLLVFHPYYRDGFTFEPGDDESLDGRPTTSVHFTHIPGRRTPAALALRGRAYPIDLKGTAWLDKRTGSVVRVQASLLNDMSDVGLRSLDIQVDYSPVRLGSSNAPADMPARAVVEVTTPRQHWRNTHVFDEYRGFSTEAEQGPSVKVHTENLDGTDGSSKATNSPAAKEKP
jgi:hypothetical protein